MPRRWTTHPTSRRWTTALLCLAALVALACEGGGGGPTPRPSTSPRAGLPGSMAALGDSITTGFGSCLVLASCERNSWSTGDGRRVESIYRRLLAENPTIRGEARNLAAPGARAASLPAQATEAVRVDVAYLTVLIGANDACRGGIDAMTPVDAFRADLDRALAIVREKRPKARILVLSIPDLHRLWEVGHTDERAVRAWRRGICPALLANATSDAPTDVARRAAFAERIDAYNGQLRAACRRYGSRCRYDGGAIHRVRFSLEMVNSLDYFHPDVDGQGRLAEVAWGASGLAGTARR
ncbi:GDSL-type esterase/lipase family protein [Micromonospora echinofusca]|uniref:SGNH/GDSL hydrolase family protein n=1 Tax=Micromonospora echinofusca TaxID=47858 RepID=A0ABS3W1R7_MICEH|nr:GDSL-type esterase/lipase family protein [Micromonospora echinofusca]MBO4210717.1 SGNH/GDSL hydrolase family protein [Micromonospora echinofusca]